MRAGPVFFSFFSAAFCPFAVMRSAEKGNLSLPASLCCDRVFNGDRQLFLLERHMKKNIRYYVLREKAVPEVLRKACEAHTLIESGKCHSVAEATERTGISRSSYYKYKDDISPYHEEKATGTTVTMLIQLDDEPGLLSKVLKTVADYGGNILTINQSIPVHGIAALTVSFALFPTSNSVEDMQTAIDETDGIHYVRILM